MEVLINEFSLDAQFESLDHFFDNLTDIITIQNVMELCSIKLLKHHELYNHKVTQSNTLHEILVDKGIRTKHEIRKFKIFLKKLMSNPPFWQDEQKHLQTDRYVCQYTQKVNGYSLAEACERSRVVVSFDHLNFKEPSIVVTKNGRQIHILNIIEQRTFADFLLEEKKISKHDYCRNRFEGSNISFSKLESDFNFDILEEDEANAFISSFRDFSEMSWDQIQQSVGLDFKKYQPSSKKEDWFANSPYADKQIYKFRTSQRFRCFGYREGTVFYVLRFERDHSISDSG